MMMMRRSDSHFLVSGLSAQVSGYTILIKKIMAQGARHKAENLRCDASDFLNISPAP